MNAQRRKEAAMSRSRCQRPGEFSQRLPQRRRGHHGCWEQRRHGTPCGIRSSRTVAACRRCPCEVQIFPRNVRIGWLVDFGWWEYLYFRSSQPADLSLEPRVHCRTRGFYFLGQAADLCGWTTPRKALWAQRGHLRRLDKLSRCPAPEWHNSRGRQQN
jgi:hypothetical protein